MKKIVYLVLLLLPSMIWAQPPVGLYGPAGAKGNFPFIYSPSVVIPTDADYTMAYPDMSGSSGVLLVTSSVSLSAPRSVIAPMVAGFGWFAENLTTGGQSIVIKGSTGTGVTIANGYGQVVWCDGTKYIAPPNGSGGTVLSVSGTAPLSSTGGANPVLSMTQANSTTNGWLLATDWAAFNAKQAPLGYTPAHAGANGDITSLSGLTTPLPTSEGGTGGAGGTGYAYGNGASAITYSPSIPSSAITGLGVGSLNSYSVTLQAATGSGGWGTATPTPQYTSTSIAGFIKVATGSNFSSGGILAITPTTPWPSNVFCRAALVPYVNALPSGLIDYFAFSTSTLDVYFITSLSTVYIEYTCTLQ